MSEKTEFVFSVAKLTGLFALVLSLFTAVYSYVLDTKLTNLELRLSQIYISKVDALPRAEYDLRNREVLLENEKQQKAIEDLQADVKKTTGWIERREEQMNRERR